MITIREATVDDLESINDIYNQTIPGHISTADTVPYSLEERVAWFRNHNPGKYPVFVAEKDGRVAGWVSLSAYRPRRDAMRYTAEVSYFVDSRYRKMGIGNEMLSFIIRESGRCNVKTLVAILLGHNIASIALLEKHGFKRWAFLPGVADFDGVERDHLFYGLRVNK